VDRTSYGLTDLPSDRLRHPVSMPRHTSVVCCGRRLPVSRVVRRLPVGDEQTALRSRQIRPAARSHLRALREARLDGLGSRRPL